MNITPDHYLVIGNPIAHSLSPQIHTEFAKQTQQILTYDRLCVEPEYFFNTLDDFFTQGGKGANITAPFKSMAFEYVQEYCSESAKLSKAVNTLYVSPVDDHIWGDNTDGIGLLRDLKRLDWDITGKKILILGTGGAVRGILPALLSEKPQSITLYNRTEVKSAVIAKEFKALGNLLAFDLNMKNMEKNRNTYDLFFNAIPSTQIAESDFLSWLPNIISADSCVYDLSYSQDRTLDTPFIDEIKKIGKIADLSNQTADGLGMLLEQAAESFFIWRGVRPTKPLLQL